MTALICHAAGDLAAILLLLCLACVGAGFEIGRRNRRGEAR